MALEELIRAIGEGQAEERPETVLAMLQARIGRFGVGPRRAVEAASVFGQTFWLGGVAALLGIPSESPQIRDWLAELVEGEVIEPHFESRLAKEKEYSFRHALVRDAAYGLLTEQDLLAGHQVAARYLVAAGESEPLALAEHYLRGAEPERAAALYLRAAEDAGRMGAMLEARQRSVKAKELLENVAPSPESSRLKVDSLLRQVQFGIMIDSTEQNLARLAEARALLGGVSGGEADLSDQRRSAWIDFLCGRASFYQGKNVEALEYFRRALPVAEALDDKQIIASASQFVGGALVGQGQIGKGLKFLARPVELKEHLDSDYNRLRALGYYAIGLTMSGHYRDGIELHEQSLALAVKSQQDAALGSAYALRCFSLLAAYECAELCKNAPLALEYAEKAKDQVSICFVLNCLCWGYSFLGEHAEAAAAIAKLQQLAQELGQRMAFADFFAVGKAEIAMRAGNHDLALSLVTSLAPELRKEGRLLSLPLAEQLFGLLIGHRDLSRKEEADTHLSAALEMMERTEQRLAAARLRLEWSHLCQRRGASEQAIALRSQAVAQFTAAGCTHAVDFIERACQNGQP